MAEAYSIGTPPLSAESPSLSRMVAMAGSLAMVGGMAGVDFLNVPSSMSAFSPGAVPLGLATVISCGRMVWRSVVKDPFRRCALGIERIYYQKLWQKQLAKEKANQAILRLLLEGGPMLVGRIGHTEGRIVGEWAFRHQRFGRLTKKEAHQYSGIFPVSPDLLSSFAEVYAASIAQVDLLGFWQTAYQARILTELYPGVQIAPLAALEPYYHRSPWSAGLEGKRVLIVHPFASSIRSQYEINRLNLFPGQRVLPQFDLEVLQPPQTLAPMTGGYATWLDALQHLTESVLNRDFDVALLGCGAYGLPLGAAIKSAGKQAIHLGGALQVLFGIRGRRWEQIPVIAALMNDSWIRPSQEETPVSASLVDQGCYW